MIVLRIVAFALLLVAPAGAQTTRSVAWDEFPFLGERIVPGQERRLMVVTSESFAGDRIETPVHVVRGRTPGPTVCLVAGIHGDELNGIEIVRQVFETLTPGAISGTVVGVPVANLHGFRRSSRYLPDRRDLNRSFPGHPAGSSASRIANALFDGVIRHCDALVDFHTGSFHRTNLPQLRADLVRPEVVQLATAFGLSWIVHSEGQPGTLRRSAVDAGIPAITYEAGEPLRFQEGEIARGLQGTRELLGHMGLIDARATERPPPTLIRASTWVRVDDGGIFLPSTRLGARVSTGELLGTVTDPILNERSEVRAPMGGRVIGMALPQVVIPGFAAFHLGDEDAALPSEPENAPDGHEAALLDPDERPE